MYEKLSPFQLYICIRPCFCSFEFLFELWIPLRPFWYSVVIYIGQAKEMRSHFITDLQYSVWQEFGVHIFYNLCSFSNR